MTTKTCRGCDTEKPLDQFNIAKMGAQGRSARCKACKNAADRARRAAIPRVTRQLRPAPVNPLLAQIDTLVTRDTLTHDQLAEASNLTPGTLLRWRRASKRGPGVFPLMRLLDTLGYELVIREKPGTLTPLSSAPTVALKAS